MFCTLRRASRARLSHRRHPRAGLTTGPPGAGRCLPRLPGLAALLLSLMVLSACGRNEPSPQPAPTAIPESTATPEPYVTPLSNQVERHEEEAAEDGDHGHTHVTDAERTDSVQVVLVPSEILVGPNRFAVGLFGADGALIHDAQVHFHFVDLNDLSQAVPRGEADAERLQTPDGATTIFTHERIFEQPGEWGVEVQVRWDDGRAARQRIGFQVLADSVTLAPGDAAPVVETLTGPRAEDDLQRVTSAADPNPALHALGLDEALANQQPTLLLFATPAFCQTRFCGPAYEIVSALQEQMPVGINYVYVELYDQLPDPAASGWRPNAAATAFGLQSEPWIYLIDSQGDIVYRVEGMFSLEEIKRALHEHLGLSVS